jgi:hypothetical protein
LSEIVLAPDIERLEFAYRGEPEPGVKRDWLTVWEGPELPELIRVRLGFAEGRARTWPDLIAAPRLWAAGQ